MSITLTCPLVTALNPNGETQLQIWATNVLREHLVKGYTLNKKALERTTAGIAELQKTINIITSVRNKKLSSDEAQGLLTIIKQYADTWTTLEAYDSGSLRKRTTTGRSILFTPEEVRRLLGELKKALVRKGEAGELFAAERDHGMEQEYWVLWTRHSAAQSCIREWKKKRRISFISRSRGRSVRRRE